MNRNKSETGNFRRPGNSGTLLVVRCSVVLIGLLLLGTTARCTQVVVGEIDLTGNFTLDHNFDFNHLDSHPFGTFGTMSVESATGVFEPYVTPGDLLVMNTPLFGFREPIQWSIRGFTVDTLWALITGADFAGRDCLGGINISGNAFDPGSYPFAPFSFWEFTAPPYDIGDFHSDITGPITLKIAVTYDDHHVPDGAATGLSLIFGLVILRLFQGNVNGNPGWQESRASGSENLVHPLR
jgi:hypothetical protein